MVAYYEARKGRWQAGYYFGQVVEQESSPPQVISRRRSNRALVKTKVAFLSGGHEVSTHTCCPHMSPPTHNAVSLQWLEEVEDYDRFAKYTEFERMQQEGVDLEACDKTTLGLTEEDWSAGHSRVRLNF